MNPINDQQLADYQALADAATPGPWHLTDSSAIVAPLTADEIADVWEPTAASRNGEFIEAAREAVPALVAEVRRLRARLWEHERPATEAERNALRQSFTELAAQAGEDGDHEGAFSLECQLREREEQWKREDAANRPAARSSVEATAPAADEDRLCNSEFPGDDMFVGQLCERERGHDGDHEHLAVIAGTRHRRRLVWPATPPAARSAAV